HRPAQRVGRAPRLTRILVSAAAVPEVQAAGRSGEPTLLQIGTGPGTRATTAAPAPAKAP
ncbi:hypothetical protein ABT086_19695, partial [Streptomyces mirabilis]